jgi:hypothetical protein
MSCSPPYSFRPDFTPSRTKKCIAPFFHEHRSRLFEGNMFFRSINQGPQTNQLELEIVGAGLNVYFYGTLVDNFPTTSGLGSIALLRAAVNNPITGSKYIEMPVLGFDIFDNRSFEDDTATGGVTSFVLTHMIGGSGPPIDDAGLAGIRTGPERTLFILASTEDLNGSPITPPWDRRVQQWNGYDWVTHSNLVQGQCPYVGVD